MIKFARVLLVFFVIAYLGLSQLAAHTIDCCDSQTHEHTTQDSHSSQANHHHSSCGHCSFSILSIPGAVVPHFAKQTFNELSNFYLPDPELRKPLQPPRG